MKGELRIKVVVFLPKDIMLEIDIPKFKHISYLFSSWCSFNDVMSPSVTLNNLSMCMVNVTKYKNVMMIDIFFNIINLLNILLHTIYFIIIKMKQNSVYQMFEIRNTQGKINIYYFNILTYVLIYYI